jgi:hypothetical protein
MDKFMFNFNNETKTSGIYGSGNYGHPVQKNPITGFQREETKEEKEQVVFFSNLAQRWFDAAGIKLFRGL